MLQLNICKINLKTLFNTITKYLMNNNQYRGIKIFIDDIESLIDSDIEDSNSFHNIKNEIKLLLDILNHTKKVGFIITTQILNYVFLRKGDIILLNPSHYLLSEIRKDKENEKYLMRFLDFQEYLIKYVSYHKGFGFYIKENFFKNKSNIKEIDVVQFMIDEKLKELNKKCF